MNPGLLAAAYLAVVNVARTRLGLPEDGRGRARFGVAAAGAALAFGALAALAGWSGPLLRSLEITPETFRIAAGIALLVAGVGAMAVPRPAAEPPARGWRAALWPVAFPLILGPEVMALAVSTGTQEGVAATLWAGGAALAVLLGLGTLPRRPLPDRVLLWASRLLATMLVAVGVWLVVDGIRDV